MLLGNWIKWEPVKNISDYYIIEKIEATIDGLKIFLIDGNYEEKKLVVTFEHSVVFYKVMDEIFASRQVGDPLEYGGSEQFSTWMFFQVADSAYVKRLTEEACVDLTIQRLIHFSFYEENTFCDK